MTLQPSNIPEMLRYYADWFISFSVDPEVRWGVELDRIADEIDGAIPREEKAAEAANK